MGDSASTDTFPADVAATRRAAGITIAPEAALHRALQERTDELERVRAELHEARATLAQLTAPPTAPDVGSTSSAPAAGAADPQRTSVEHELATLRRERDEARAELRHIKRSVEIRTWSVSVFGD